MYVTSLLCGPRADLWPFIGFYVNGKLEYKPLYREKNRSHKNPRLFTVPYFFVRLFRYTASYRHEYLDF